MGACCPVFRRPKRDTGQKYRRMSECNKDEEIAELRDVKLLRELSEHFTIPLEMIDLGIALGILPRLVESYRDKNQDNIQSAVFFMLYDLWYRNQDGLGRNSNGLLKLKNALCDQRVGKALLTKTVLEAWSEVD